MQKATFPSAFTGVFVLLLAVLLLPAVTRAAESPEFDLRLKGAWMNWLGDEPSLSNFDTIHTTLGFWAYPVRGFTVGFEVSYFRRDRYIGGDEFSLAPEDGLTRQLDEPALIAFEGVPLSIVLGYTFGDREKRWRPYLMAGGGATLMTTEIQAQIFYYDPSIDFGPDDFPFPVDAEEIEETETEINWHAFARAGLALHPSARYSFTLEVEYEIGEAMDWDFLGEADRDNLRVGFGFLLHL